MDYNLPSKRQSQSMDNGYDQEEKGGDLFITFVCHIKFIIPQII